MFKTELFYEGFAFSTNFAGNDIYIHRLNSVDIAFKTPGFNVCQTLCLILDIFFSPVVLFRQLLGDRHSGFMICKSGERYFLIPGRVWYVQGFKSY